MIDWSITAGDARTVLAGWPAEAVQTVVTSPPYYLLRDYGTGRWEGGDPACDHRKVRDAAFAVATSTLGGGKKTTGHLQEGYSGQCARCGARRIDEQIGLESSLDAYIANLVTVFRAVRRVLAPTGTLWLNIGDSYSNAGRAGSRGTKRGAGKPGWTDGGALGDKQLLLVPFRVAMALQQDGWILRKVIPWVKRNAMPESAKDRPSSSLEYVFVFSPGARYYFDMEAVKEYLAIDRNWRDGDFLLDEDGQLVFDIPTQAYAGAHFAVMPERLAEACILAGSSQAGQCAACGAPWARVTAGQKYTPPVVPIEDHKVDASRNDKTRKLNGKSKEWRAAAQSRITTGWAPTCRCAAGAPVPQLVADPFTGAGTVGVVALRHGRAFWGAELNEAYCKMASDRIVGDSPLFNRQEGAA